MNLPKDNNSASLLELIKEKKWMLIVFGAFLVAGVGYCAVAGDGEPEEEVAFVGSF